MKKLIEHPVPPNEGEECNGVGGDAVAAASGKATKGFLRGRRGNATIKRCTDADPSLQGTVAETLDVLEMGAYRMESRTGHHASLEEAARYLGVCLQEYLFMLEEVYPVPLFASASSNGEMWGMESPRKEACDAGFVFEDFLVRVLARTIGSLPEKEQYVLSLHHQDKLTAEEIGLVLDLPKCEVKQLHSLAMIRVRASLCRATISAKYPGVNESGGRISTTSKEI